MKATKMFWPMPHLGGLIAEALRLEATAIRLYDRARVSGGGWMPAYRQGIIHYKRKRWNHAAGYFREAIAAAPWHAHSHFKLGMCYFRKKDWKSAEAAMETALSLAPAQNKWRVQLVQVERNLKNWRKAEQIEQVLLKSTGPEDAEMLFQRGLGLLQKKQWRAAEQAFKEAVARAPGCARYFWELGNAVEQLGRDWEATETFGRAVELDPANGDWWFKYATLLERMNRFEDAGEAYRRALALQPEQPGRRYRLGFALEQAGQAEEAAAAYAEAVEHDASGRGKRFGIGIYHAERGLWDEAARAYELAAEKDPENAELFHRLGMAHERCFRWQEAAAAYRRALALDAVQADWHYRLGFVLERLQQWEPAAEAYRAAVARKETYEGDWYYRLGYVLSRAGRLAEACEAFRESRLRQSPCAIDPGSYLEEKGFEKVINYTEYFETAAVRDKVVLYESYFGASMGCNPYAIFKYLVAQPDFQDWLHVWVLNDENRIPGAFRSFANIVFVKKDSDLYLRYLASAKYLINNVSFPYYFIRKPAQVYLNTWHGTPWKTLGKDIQSPFFEHKNVARNFLQTTHLISPNPHTTQVMLERYDVGGLFRGAFSECGYPRLDSTLNAGPEEKAALRRKLGVGPDARVVLYAPTWRGELGDAHVDTERLLTDIKLLAGLDCALVFRGHHLVEKMLTDLPLGIRVASSEIDTNELLSVVDILITDYSSIFFDFMATGRPILHYVYDLETYSRERGLYFDLGELPGDKCHDLSQLRDVLQGHLKTPFTPGEGYRQAQRRFCPQDDGGAARRVVDTVFYGMDRWALTRPVDERQSLLFFLGSFMPNGITTSFINLVNNLDRRRFRPTVIVEPLNMAAFPERLEQFAKIPKDVAVLGRVGQMNLTIEERWVREEFESRHKLASPALWHIYQQAFRREYARIFGQSRFDVLINFDGYARFWASTFAFGPDGSRKVIYQHNDMFDEWKVRFPYLGGIFNLCRHQDGLISVSPSVLESNLNNLQTPFSLDDQVFDFCNNPINPSLVQSLAQEGLETPAFHDFSKETAVRFVTMGRLSPEKDHAKLIRAFTQVHAQNPDTALYILGDGPLRHQLENQITTLGLHRAVHLLGQQSNPFPFLKQADCFVFSSNHEGQGLVLLEALILGRPAVSTDIPGPRSVLEGGYGHLVDNSEAGLVQGMSDFLDGKLSFKAFDARQYQTEAMEMFYDKVCQAGQPGKGRNRVG